MRHPNAEPVRRRDLLYGVGLCSAAIVTTIVILQFWDDLFRWVYPVSWPVAAALRWKAVQLSLSPLACLALALFGLVRTWRLAPLRQWTFGHLAAVQFGLFSLHFVLDLAQLTLIETTLPIPQESWLVIYSVTYSGLELTRSVTLWVAALTGLSWAGLRIGRWSGRRRLPAAEPGVAAETGPE